MAKLFFLITNHVPYLLTMRLSQIIVSTRRFAERAMRAFLENTTLSGCVEWTTTDGRSGRNLFAGMKRAEVEVFVRRVCALTPCAPIGGRIATVTYRVRSWFDVSLAGVKIPFWLVAQ